MGKTQGCLVVFVIPPGQMVVHTQATTEKKNSSYFEFFVFHCYGFLRCELIASIHASRWLTLKGEEGNEMKANRGLRG